MKSFSKAFFFFIIFFCTAECKAYVSPIPPEAVDTLKAHMAMRFQEPVRYGVAPMDIDKIIRDIYYKGMDYFEQNYPQEVVNIVKPAYKSYRKIRPYGVHKDKEGKIYITSQSEDRIPRYYLQDIEKYGKVRPPVLVYSILGRGGDEYVVPLAYKDTIVAYVHFDADSFDFLAMGYTDRSGNYFYGLTNYPTIDSAEAYSIMQSGLALGEEIVSQRLFNIGLSGLPYWGFLTQTTTKAKGITEDIYWIDPITKEPK